MPNDKTPESQATFPWIFTVTMYDGHWTMKHRQADGDFEDGEGTYTLDGDRLVFDFGGGIVASNVHVDADGTLHLTAQGRRWQSSDDQPWTKIAAGPTPQRPFGRHLPLDLTKDEPHPRAPTRRNHDVPVGLHDDDGRRTGSWPSTVKVSQPDAGHGSYTWRATTSCSTRPRGFDYTSASTPTAPCTSSAQPPINPGTAWVFATNPWTKID